MKAVVWSSLFLCVLLSMAPESGAQPHVGALAIDERQGDRWGWAVDYETAAAAEERALRGCGSGCSVVLTFDRCGAFAADQDANSTAVGWAESYGSAVDAQQAAESECRARGGGSGCVVRVWGCNGPVVEEGLGLGRVARRQIQLGLRAAGFDPGGADGLFGPRTRAAIRSWQSARGTRTTGYLDGPQAQALRDRRMSRPPASAAGTTPDSEGLEVVFWQSIQNSTNPAEFEAYLQQFPNGVFRALAQVRLAALRTSAGGGTLAAGARVGGDGSRPSGARVSAAPTSVSGSVTATDARPPSDTTFRPEETCAGKPPGAACWMEISRQPGCRVWNWGLVLGATVTWTGACPGGLAQGTGTLTWVLDDYRRTDTGRLLDGKLTGHWVARGSDGTVAEGPTVDGEWNGHWVRRNPDGTVAEGPAVGGTWHGRWIIRDASGDFLREEWWEDGRRTR